jgi:hypothetical protein
MVSGLPIKKHGLVVKSLYLLLPGAMAVLYTG